MQPPPTRRAWAAAKGWPATWPIRSAIWRGQICYAAQACPQARGDPAQQRAGAREVAAQELHLVCQDVAPHQEDVLGMGRGEGDGQELHPRRLRGAPGLVVVAAHAGGDHVVPTVAAAQAQGPDVVAGQVPRGEAPAAVEADVVVALEQGAVGQGRGIVVLELDHRVVIAARGDDGVDGQLAAAAGRRVGSAVQEEERVAVGVGHLSEAVEPGGGSIVHPLEGQPREVRA